MKLSLKALLITAALFTSNAIAAESQNISDKQNSAQDSKLTKDQIKEAKKLAKEQAKAQEKAAKEAKAIADAKAKEDAANAELEALRSKAKLEEAQAKELSERNEDTTEEGSKTSKKDKKQTTDKSIDVTVSATKLSKEVGTSPSTTSVIQADTVNNASSGNLFDVFKNSASIRVSSNSRASGQELSVRGYSGQSVLTMIDDVKFNGYSAHDGTTYLNPALIKSVDTSLGSFGSIYGSGSMGATIIFKTKDAQDLLLNGQRNGYSAYTDYASANHASFSNLAAYGANNILDYVVSVGYKGAGNVSLPNGDKLEEDEETYSGMVKLKWYLGDKSTLKIQNTSYLGDIEDPDNPTVVPGSGEDLINPKVKKNIGNYNTYLNYNFDNDSNNLNAKLYHAYYKVKETLLEDSSAIIFDSSHLKGDILTREIHTIGADVYNENFLFNNTKLLYGVEAHVDYQDGTDSRFGERGGVPDARANYYGAYIEGSTAILSKNVLTLDYGLKVDGYSSSALNQDSSNSDYAFSPKIGLIYAPVKGFSVFANYSESFRAPNMTELYSTDLHFPGTNFPFPLPNIPDNYFIPNPDLRPESNQTVEVGFRTSYWNLDINASGYATKSSNFIDRDVNVLAGTSQFVNIYDANIYGVDVGVSYSLGYGTHFDASYSFSDGRNKTKGDKYNQYLKDISPHTFVTNIYTPILNGDMRNVIGWRTTSALAQTHVKDLEEDYLSGYVTTDIYYRWSPMDSFYVHVGIDNLLDKAYSIITSGIVEPGRSYKVQASYKW